LDDPEEQTRTVIGCKRLLVAIFYPEAYEALTALERDPTEANKVRFERELLKIKEMRTKGNRKRGVVELSD